MDIFILGTHNKGGPIKCYITQCGVRGILISADQHYEGVRSHIISITGGWVGVLFPEKTLTFEWP